MGAVVLIWAEVPREHNMGCPYLAKFLLWWRNPVAPGGALVCRGMRRFPGAYAAGLIHVALRAERTTAGALLTAASRSPRWMRTSRDPGFPGEGLQPPLGGDGPGVVGAELAAEVLISRKQKGPGFGGPAAGGQAASQQAAGGGGGPGGLRARPLGDPDPPGAP